MWHNILVHLFGDVLSKTTKINFLVSFHEEVCIDFNFIYLLSLSPSLSLYLYLSPPLSLTLSLPLSLSLSFLPYCVSMGVFVLVYIDTTHTIMHTITHKHTHTQCFPQIMDIWRSTCSKQWKVLRDIGMRMIWCW